MTSTYKLVIPSMYYSILNGDSIKTKPNCLCHKYLILDHIIMTLSKYLDNSTKNMIPTYRNIFSMDKKICVFED